MGLRVGVTDSRSGVLILVLCCLACCAFGRVSEVYAQDLCVGVAADCPAGATSVPGDLQDALDAAASNNTDDRLFVARGTYKTSDNGGGAYSYQDDEQLQIVGTVVNGSKATIVEVDTPTAVGLTVGPSGSTESTSTVSNVAVKLNADAAVGLQLKNGVDATGVEITVGAGAASNSGDSHGIYLLDNVGTTTLTDSNVAMDGHNVGAAFSYAVGVYKTVGVVGSGAVVTDVTASNADHGVFVSNGTSNTDTVDLSRLRIKANVDYGVTLFNSSVTLKDSLIQSTAGIWALDSPGNATELDADRVTLVHTTQGSSGAGLFAASSSAGGSVAATLTDSVVYGYGASVHRAASGGGTADLTVTRSFYDSAKAQDSGSGTLVPAAADYLINDITFNPGFVDSAAGDFRLKSTSSLVDKGAVQAGPSANCATGTPVYDLGGLCRYVDGNGDGNKAFDVGAYEYGRNAPTATVSASTQSAQIGQQVTFSAAGSSDSDAGDELTYSWAFSDGSTATGQSVDKTFSAPGNYTATVTVVDPTGLTASASQTVQITTPSTTGPVNPPPPVDFPPTVTISKPPKKRLERKGRLKFLEGTASDDKRLASLKLSVILKGRRSGRVGCFLVPKSANVDMKTARFYPLVNKKCVHSYKIEVQRRRNWKFNFLKELPPGSYLVSVRVTDSGGKTATDEISFTVFRRSV